MCTSITLKTEDVYFGRNLDLEYRFNENVVITPRNYKIKLKNKDVLNIDYAIIGMATVVDDYPLYAEAANEEGLAKIGRASCRERGKSWVGAGCGIKRRDSYRASR